MGIKEKKAVLIETIISELNLPKTIEIITELNKINLELMTRISRGIEAMKCQKLTSGLVEDGKVKV
jgi:hypothetical protein